MVQISHSGASREVLLVPLSVLASHSLHSSLPGSTLSVSLPLPAQFYAWFTVFTAEPGQDHSSSLSHTHTPTHTYTLHIHHTYAHTYHTHTNISYTHISHHTHHTSNHTHHIKTSNTNISYASIIHICTYMNTNTHIQRRTQRAQTFIYIHKHKYTPHTKQTHI